MPTKHPNERDVYAVRRRSSNLHEITLPPSWLRDNQIKKGDLLKVEPQADGSLLMRRVVS